MVISSTKVAQTQHELLPAIANRWSARAFAATPVLPATVEALVEAAAWAPSAMNEQPWRFVAAHQADTERFTQLLALLSPGNQLWAAKAPLLVVVLAKQTYTANGAANGSAAHDVGMATQNLLLQATHLGLHSHVMGGFDRAQTETLLNLGPDFKAVTMLAIGYSAPAETLEEPFRSREIAPRSRKPIHELLLDF